MNLLDLRIPLRKRRLDEIFDLALIVIRSNSWRYLRILLPFCGVFILINYGISLVLPDNILVQNGIICAMLLMEAGIAELFLTALHGRIVFEVKPRFRDIARDIKSVALTYIVRIVLVHTAFTTILLPFLLPPVRALFTHFFLAEAIVLERLRGGPLSTRAAVLSRGQGDRIAGFYVFALCIFSAGLVCTVYGLDSLREMMGDWAEKRIPNPGFHPSQLIFQIVFFPAAAYLSLCRFLLYLDTRIAGEGWDIELMLARGIEETEREPEALRVRKKSA